MDTHFAAPPEASPRTTRKPRLSDVLFAVENYSFASLAVVQSNVQAAEAAIRFANGANSFVALYGPSGWGKTHMLAAAARTFRYELRKLPIPVVSAAEWIADTRLRDYDGPLILDNAQDLVEKTRSMQQLKLTLERRVRAGKPTLLSFTGAKPSRPMRLSLPKYREWIIAGIKTPSPAEREKIVRQIAETELVTLSPNLIRLLAHKLQGNGRTLLGAIKRLKLDAGQWSDDASTLRACGALNLFLCANSGWDLRERIAEAAREWSSACDSAIGFDLAVYTMLRVAQLPEADVANFFRIAPSKAYGYANRFEERVQRCSATAESTTAFLRQVIDDL